MLEKDASVISDEARSRGADIKLPTDAAAELTLGQKDKFRRGWSKRETREEFAAPECIGIGPGGRDCGVRHSPSFKSDVYSFGLMIVEAIAKEGPLETMHREGIRERKRSNLLVRPAAMTAEACNLVQRMCVCDPAQRVSLAFVTEQLGQLAQ